MIWSAIAVAYRLGFRPAVRCNPFGKPMDKQATYAQKGFPLPSGLLNLGG